jgi:hypothetical protein
VTSATGWSSSPSACGFDTTHAIVASTVSQDLPQLRTAAARMLARAVGD